MMLLFWGRGFSFVFYFVWGFVVCVGGGLHACVYVCVRATMCVCVYVRAYMRAYVCVCVQTLPNQD